MILSSWWAFVLQSYILGYINKQLEKTSFPLESIVCFLISYKNTEF